MLPKVQIGFLFDWYAWGVLKQHFDVDVNELSKSDWNDLIRKMLYCSAVSYFKEYGKKRWFTEQTVNGWIEQMTMKQYEQIGKVFTESLQAADETAKEVEKEMEIKKK